MTDRRNRSLVGVIAFLTIGGALFLLQTRAMPTTADLAVAGLFAGFMTLAWLFPLPLTDKTKLYLDTTVTIGAVLFFAPGVAMLIVGAGTLLGQVLRRQPGEQAVFNAAQVMLQAAAGAGVLAATGWNVEEMLSGGSMQLLIIVVAGIAVSAINLLAVAAIVRLQTGSAALRVVGQIIRSMTVTEYVAQAVQISLGVIAAALAATAPWAVALLLAPGAAVFWVLQHNIALRQQLAATLRDREASLAEAERIAKLGSWDWRLGAEEQRWSDETFRLLGLHPEAATPTFQTFVQYVHPDDRITFNNAVQRAVSTGTAFDLDHRILRADGIERMVHTHGSLICDATGEPVRMVGTVHDVTERKALEARLLQQAVQPQLSVREVEVLGFLASGNSNKEIAVMLGISEQTVKNHISSIFRKLRVNDRTQAVVYAVRHGWIKLEDADGEQRIPSA